MMRARFFVATTRAASFALAASLAYVAALGGAAEARPGHVGEPLRVLAFPFVHRHSTDGHTSVIARYSCSTGISEGGPEVIYEVQLPREGELTASTSGDSAWICKPHRRVARRCSSRCTTRARRPRWESAGGSRWSPSTGTRRRRRG